MFNRMFMVRILPLINALPASGIKQTVAAKRAEMAGD